MAQLIDISIHIDRRDIKQFSSLTLSQEIFEHHSFRLECPAESIDNTSGGVFSSSKNLVGKNITISINAVESAGNFEFKGVVTQVEASRHSGYAGDIIIRGQSPTILLDNGPHCKSWENKAIRNIAVDVLKHFPNNMTTEVLPLNNDVFSYTVQYKETAWQFLNRLSALNGEWFFYNGSKLILGPPKGGDAKLLFGSNLDRFNIVFQARPARFQMMAYDYVNAEVYTGAPESINGIAGLNGLGSEALQKSQQFYAAQPKQWNNNYLTSKRQLDDFVNTKGAIQASSMIRMNGSSSHPGVQVGSSICVRAEKNSNPSNESLGNYTVISANHYCDGQRNYTNDFEAIPASVKVPPVAITREPHCETQSALVTDNYDPNGLGRIRVKFHWMNGVEKTPWLRIASPHGGLGKGMFFIPEKDEEVIVGFEGDSAVKPYIIGTVYNGAEKTQFGNKENDVKAVQTRSGNKLIMNDKEGSVNLTDKGGANMYFDGAGNATTHASENHSINAGSTHTTGVGAKKDAPPQSLLQMDAGGNIVLDGKTSIVFRVGGNSIIITREGITGTALEGDIKLDATAGKFLIHSASEMKVASDAALAIAGGPTTTISATEVEINQS